MTDVGRGSAQGQILFWDNAYQGYRWMPRVAPTSGQVLKWDGSEPVWATGGGGFTAGGDLSSSPVNQTVIGLRTRSLDTATPGNGQVLTWVASTSKWTPALYPSPMWGGVFTYATVVAAQAATGWNGKVGYVVETDTFYRYVGSDASSTTADGLVILSTGNGGNTRWLAVAGRYGNIANSELPTPNSPTYGATTNAFVGKGSLGRALFGGGVGIGAYNTAAGCDTGGKMSLGMSRNTYVGFSAGLYIYQFTTPFDSCNTCIGSFTGTSGSGSLSQSTYLIAIGMYAANSVNNTSTRLIAIGYSAGVNTRGSDNICFGVQTGTNTGFTPGSGSNNVFVGATSGYSHTTGIRNTCFVGGGNVTTGSYNALLGLGDSITTGSYNATLGNAHLLSVTTGSYNTAIGYLNLAAGAGNVGRLGSVAIGYRSGAVDKDYCIVIGEDAMMNGSYGVTVPSYDIAIGRYALQANAGVGYERTLGSNLAFGRETMYRARHGITSNLCVGYRSGCGTYACYDLTCVGAYTVSGRDPENVESIGGYGTQACGDTAIGSLALEWLGGYGSPSTPTFSANTAVGCQALNQLRWGLNNVGLGYNAGFNPAHINNTTSVGYNAGPEAFTATWTYDTRFAWSIAPGSISESSNGNMTFVKEGGAWYVCAIDITTPPPLPHYGTVKGPAAHWLGMGWSDRNTLFGINARRVYNSTDAVRLGSSGSPCYGGTYNTDSDIHLKMNVEPCDLGLAFIRTLQPRKFEMQADPGKKLHGLIAQEVGTSLDTLGVESNIREKSITGNETQSVAYEALVAPLVMAVQELAAQVSALRTRVAVLRNGG